MMAGKKKGSVTLEFTLVGIPLIFALISTVEMARGMWLFETQIYAINAGARYVAVHGQGCSSNGSSCSTTIGNIASAIANAGVGLAPADWNVTLYSASGSNNQTCYPLSSCLSSSTVWPPSPDNQEGLGVAIAGTYPFNSALSMFFPGSKPTLFAGTYKLPAYSQQRILF